MEMNAQTAKLQAAENDLKQLMADVSLAMEKAEEAVVDRCLGAVRFPKAQAIFFRRRHQPITFLKMPAAYQPEVPSPSRNRETAREKVRYTEPYAGCSCGRDSVAATEYPRPDWPA
jgi:hypothetical protein